MLSRAAIAYLILQLSAGTAAAATWPSSYDELEDIMLLNQGYNARQLSLPVTPCDFQRAPGFIPAAGFLRTAFHDVAPHNAATGEGGLDASIAFELTGEAGKDNAGPFVNNTLTFLSRFYSTDASMSDLLSLAVYTAVRGCGGPAIPVRTGRKDASAAGSLGVPKVEGTQQDFKRDFTRMGFTTQEMVQLVACGHTLGGVHSAQFPQIVANGTQPNNVQNFDRSPAVYGNAVAVDFVNNNSVNPLVVGPERTNSDTKVYTADGGVTIRQLTDAQTYQDSCKAILQKMVDTVPVGSRLTDPIEVYDVKPGALQLELANDGKTLNFKGEIRVRTTKLPQSSIGSVSLVYKTRVGAKGDSISTTVVGTAAGYDESFTFYSFSARLDAKTSISTFNVLVVGNDGSSKTYDNNGKGYPVQDEIFLQHPKCSLGVTDASGSQLAKVLIAVRGSPSRVSLISHLQTARDVPFPLMSTSEVTLSKDDSVRDYTYYSGHFSVTASQINSTTIDLSASLDGKDIESRFHKISKFGLPPSTGDDAHNGGNNGTHSSATTSGGTASPTTTSSVTSISGSHDVSSWTDWPQLSPSSTDAPNYQTNVPQKPHRPCGPEEGCDAANWATETIWAVPTPGALSHTKPAGICTDKPTLGATDSSGADQPSHPEATISAIIAANHSSAVNNTPVSPSTPIAPFSAGASRAAAGLVAICAAMGAIML